MSTIKAYFKFFVLLPHSPTLQCWLLAKESQEQPRTQHCNGGAGGGGKECKFLFGFKGFNRGAGGEGERSANFYLDLRGFLMSQLNMCSGF